MRAKMSDRARRPFSGYGTLPDDERIALDEARAILAETEDDALPCEARNLPGIFRADVARLVRAFVED